MSLIEVHIHPADGQPARAITVDESISVEELLAKAFPESHAEFELVLQEEGEALKPQHRLSDAGIRNQHHVHGRKKFHLVVNGKRKPYSGKIISFDEVVTLAFGPPNYDTSVYTMTYYRGPEQNPKGTLTRGHSVYVKNGMVFDVIRTDKS